MVSLHGFFIRANKAPAKCFSFKSLKGIRTR